MRRLAIALLLSPLALMGARVAEAGATTDTTATVADSSGEAVAEGLAPVDVMQVSGLFDEVTVQSVIDAIDRAADRGSQAIILQLSSGGAVVDAARMTELLEYVADAPIAVGVWAGPSKDTTVYGGPAQLFAVADASAMVVGSRLGHTGDALVPAAELLAAEVRDRSVSFADARRLGLLALSTSDEGVPTVRSMVLAMDGLVLDDGTVLDTVAQQLADDGTTQNVSTLVRFNGLGLAEEMFHTVASPEIAYLFFVIGACLLIFEFFTAGVGVAGIVGAVLLVLGCYGLEALPFRTAALVMLVLAFVAFSIDVQVGIPRFWTSAGMVLFTLASWFMFPSLPGHDLRIGWITLATGIIGVALTFVVGMPSMVRTRFATPTIGREWMIGSEGAAIGAIDPEGVAQVGESKWRARTNRATPIAAGDALRVIAIDGVTLEVEPLEGAARDYRERRSSSESEAADAESPSEG
ncbi:MAG: hypothetical protein RLZ04_2417 [Actinomycetota bacterium]